MFTFRTSPPPTYIPPTQEEMREAAKGVGLGSFSRDLVADLCNLGSGGKINPPSSYREKLYQAADDKLPAPDSDGKWKLASGAYTASRQEKILDEVGKQVRYHQNVSDFLSAVDLTKFPGNSPLEQAMSMLKLLSKKSGGQGGGEGGEPLPIFAQNDKSEEVARDLNEIMDSVDSLEQEEQDMLDPSGNNHSVIKEQDGQRSGHNGELDRLKVAEDLCDPGKAKMLEVSRKLDSFTRMQVRKQKLLEADPTGEEIRQRAIRNLGELPRVVKSAWATRQQNPSYFLYKAVSGQLPVRERVTRLEKKQAIFILVDGSGSMRDGDKHWKASGVVMNRLKAVLAGDAEVFISVFDTDMGNVWSVKTPEQARDMIKKYTQKNFSGGGTDIAAAVRSAHKYIEELIQKGEALYRPEVVVLTDEDTSVEGLKKSEIPGTKVHGFAMSVKNPSLVSFAQSTGGVGVDKF